MLFLRLTVLSNALAATLFLAHPVFAQIEKEPVGSVDASIGDTSYAGETLYVPSEGTSTAEYRSFGPVTSLSIQAHDPKAASIMHNVLSIDISLMGNAASATLMDGTSVSWWPEGMSEPFYLSDDSGTTPEVTFDLLSLEEGKARVKGDFSARLCRRDNFTAEPDLNDCIAVEGEFDTTLQYAN